MNGASPLFIGIAGGSGSGKTWLSRRIATALPGQALRVPLDNFYRDRSHLSRARRGLINYDHPRAIDWRLVLRFLKECSGGKEPMMPHYDFATHSRSDVKVCEAKPVVVIEGLWTLWKREVRDMLDISIYLECPGEVCLERRILRDTTERGRDAAEVIEQFRRTVAPMHARHVVPQKRWATTVLNHPISETHVEELLARARACLQCRNALILSAPFNQWEQRDWRDVA